MLAADFEAYWEAQRQIDRLWQDAAGWRRQSLLTTARMGSFSSDRTIRNYASEIWNAKTFA
jgi:starch phosphorylase